jgi:hypothetical protein
LADKDNAATVTTTLSADTVLRLEVRNFGDKRLPETADGEFLKGCYSWITPELIYSVSSSSVSIEKSTLILDLNLF